MSDGGRIAATRGEGAAPRSTRRSLLRGAAGLGVAGVAAGFLAGRTVTPAAADERADAAPQDGTASQAGMVPAHDEPLVVHVHDARTGVVDLFTGTRHVRFTDPQLAARLARAAQA